MPATIQLKRQLADGVFCYDVHAPRISRKYLPGQFVILRVTETGERIPLTIADRDTGTGSIRLIFKVVGKTTSLLAALNQGDDILDVAGPLGTPSHIERFGRVVCVGGGIGTAVLYPIARALKEAGNAVITLLGGRSAEHIILENEMGAFSDRVLVATDDGSRGRKAFVTGLLDEVMKEGAPIDYVIAGGPLPMMNAVARLTRPAGIRTTVSLNPIMIDGTGMCGGCRVTIAGQTRYACVDGPEFDGHQVDFDALGKRLQAYAEQESIARESCRHEDGTGG